MYPFTIKLKLRESNENNRNVNVYDDIRAALGTDKSEKRNIEKLVQAHMCSIEEEFKTQISSQI